MLQLCRQHCRGRATIRAAPGRITRHRETIWICSPTCPEVPLGRFGERRVPRSDSPSETALTSSTTSLRRPVGSLEWIRTYQDLRTNLCGGSKYANTSGPSLDRSEPRAQNDWRAKAPAPMFY
jgi:hypothetical protein